MTYLSPQSTLPLSSNTLPLKFSNWLAMPRVTTRNNVSFLATCNLPSVTTKSWTNSSVTSLSHKVVLSHTSNPKWVYLFCSPSGYSCFIYSFCRRRRWRVKRKAHRRMYRYLAYRLRRSVYLLYSLCIFLSLRDTYRFIVHMFALSWGHLHPCPIWFVQFGIEWSVVWDSCWLSSWGKYVVKVIVLTVRGVSMK